MDYSQILGTVITVIVIPTVLYIGKLLKTLIDAKITQISTTTTNETLQYYLSLIQDLADKAVTETQSLVDKCKEAAADGKLTEEEKNDIKEHAIRVLIAMLPTPKTTTGRNLLEVIGIDQNILDNLIDSSIEKAVADINKSKSQ